MDAVIIDFAIKNYRSFKEEQRLSFVASNYDHDLPQNLIEQNLPGLEGIRLLKGVAIYGANAAGKTNVLHALNYLSEMVKNSASKLDEGDSTGTEPFALDEDFPLEPSEFALRFVVGGVRYHLALMVNRERVLYESLSAFPQGKERVWYERSWDPDSEQYDWLPTTPTGYKRDTALQARTRENALFLSTAVKWNDEQLKPVYLWFKSKLRFYNLADVISRPNPNETGKLWLEVEGMKPAFLKLLAHADLGISDARVEVTEQPLQLRLIKKDIPEASQSYKRYEVTFLHKGSQGKTYELHWNRQSAGTRRFFAMIAPWLMMMSEARTSCFDEIEASMHPTMVAELLRLVFSSLNEEGGQVLFTTHNPLLLDPNLIRRDQVWFADKDEEGATHLYPLTDYKPRKGESLARGYLAGRYGAVPFIPSGLLGREVQDGEE